VDPFRSFFPGLCRPGCLRAHGDFAGAGAWGCGPSGARPGSGFGRVRGPPQFLQSIRVSWFSGAFTIVDRCSDTSNPDCRPHDHATFWPGRVNGCVQDIDMLDDLACVLTRDLRDHVGQHRWRGSPRHIRPTLAETSGGSTGRGRPCSLFQSRLVKSTSPGIPSCRRLLGKVQKTGPKS